MEYILIKGNKSREILMYTKGEYNQLAYKETITYDEFLNFYRDLINTRINAEAIDFTNGILTVNNFTYKEEELSYTFSEDKIHFTADLLQDESFKSILDDIQSEYKRVSEEIKSNIKNKSEFLREAKKFITGYLKNGKIDGKFDKQFIGSLREYVADNKDKIERFLDKNVFDGHSFRNKEKFHKILEDKIVYYTGLVCLIALAVTIGLFLAGFVWASLPFKISFGIFGAVTLTGVCQIYPKNLELHL